MYEIGGKMEVLPMKRNKIIKTVVVQTVISVFMVSVAYLIGDILKKQFKG
jgi:hypothetical protein